MFREKLVHPTSDDLLDHERRLPFLGAAVAHELVNRGRSKIVRLFLTFLVVEKWQADTLPPEAAPRRMPPEVPGAPSLPGSEGEIPG